MLRRNVLLVAACLTAPALWGAANAVSQGPVAATRVQAAVASALSDLKLKGLEADRPGAPQQFEVTKETLEFLNDKVVTVSEDGSIQVKKKDK